LLDVIGRPADSLRYSFSCFESSIVSDEEQRMADVAASVQLVFEECVLELVKYLKQNSISKNLCFAGGAALNCVSNSRILKESGFENLFIPIDPGDAGASIGAAAYGHLTLSCEDVSSQTYSAYLGSANQSATTFTQMVRNINPLKLKKFSQFEQTGLLEWQVEVVEDESDLIAQAADYIAQAKIVGWFQNNSEYGPRALGNRSILIRPDNLDLAKRLSTKVKERAFYRPYALSMTDSASIELLEESSENIKSQRPYEWMQLATPVKSSMRSRVFTGLHIDGTTRPQVVKPEANSRYYKLLKTVGEKIGLNCVVNTSFNESGYPIVQTPDEALLMFARTDMDILIVENTVIRKVRSYDTH
jgi:carbamoyltransferase